MQDQAYQRRDNAQEHCELEQRPEARVYQGRAELPEDQADACEGDTEED